MYQDSVSSSFTFLLELIRSTGEFNFLTYLRMKVCFIFVIKGLLLLYFTIGEIIFRVK